MSFRASVAVAAAALAVGLPGLTAPARAADKPVTLILEWTGFQPQHFGFWLAKQRGWYHEEGLDVAIKSSGGSAPAMQILVGGQADFGNVASSSLVQAVGKGNVPLRMVAVFGQRDSLSMAYFESTGIKQPKDIEGRKLGLVPGSLAHTLWPSFAKATGIDVSKVQIVNWDFRSYYGIFGAKQVDVSGNFTLGSTGQWLFKKKGETVKQFVFSDYLPLLGSGIAVRTDMLQKDPTTVRKFVRATQRAWKYLATEPKKAVPEAAAIVVKQFDEMPPAEVIAEYAYEMVPDRMVSAATKDHPMGWSSEADWSKMVELLRGYDPAMTRSPTVAELMTNDYLAK
jgi:NitT/TauT family transport system substrate-binding protein